ncbi:MAG TPA: hypothetical protein IAA51_02940 [Candidatus Cottocaccamicrobium excrementipullorum]|nr:hypothetical protein [Candidatus Cottocaccamicrobium excrementipullorum]
MVTVQDGGKTGAKTGVKLAYKHDFAPVFPSDGHPGFCPASAGQEDAPSEIVTINVFAVCGPGSTKASRHHKKTERNA